MWEVGAVEEGKKSCEQRFNTESELGVLDGGGGHHMPPIYAATTRGILIIPFRHEAKFVHNEKSHTQTPTVLNFTHTAGNHVGNILIYCTLKFQ